MPKFTDQFSLQVGYATLDSSINTGEVTVTPSGSQFAFSVPFTYVPGIPAATAFQLAWSGEAPSSAAINPSSPQGNGAQVRNGTISGIVAPSQTTTYRGRITIVQA